MVVESGVIALNFIRDVHFVSELFRTGTCPANITTLQCHRGFPSLNILLLKQNLLTRQIPTSYKGYVGEIQSLFASVRHKRPQYETFSLGHVLSVSSNCCSFYFIFEFASIDMLNVATYCTVDCK